MAAFHSPGCWPDTTGSVSRLVDTQRTGAAYQSYFDNISPIKIVLNKTHAYVAYGSRGIHILDIQVKRHPKLIARYDIQGYARDIALSGNYVYIADGGNGLQIIDISDPANPVLAASQTTYGGAMSVVVDEKYVYVGEESFGVEIFELYH